MTVAALRVRAHTAVWSGWASYFRMERTPGALPELDGLRALAIVLVLLRHGIRPFHPEVTPLLPLGGWDAATPFVNGWMGVDLFFVLSGFLITHHICRRYGQGMDRRGAADYLARRALRIVPAYYAVLLLAAAGAFPLYEVAPADLGWRIAYHLLFMQDYLPADIVVVFWSLGVEEKFYLLAPLLLAGVLACRRRAAQYAAVAGVALLPTAFRALTRLGSPERLDYESFFMLFRSPFHLSFDGLAIGMLCALVYRDREQLGWARRRGAIDALFWAGAAGMAYLLFARPLLARIGVFETVFLEAVLALALGAVLLALALGGGPRAWFRPYPLFMVSKLAYTLYLAHYVLIPGVLAGVGGLVAFEHLPRALQLAAFLPCYLAASTVTALLLHYLVEKPFLLLRDRLPAYA
jgi:peptidoglycan/LPS O-acetylase OafA/YrhL